MEAAWLARANLIGPGHQIRDFDLDGDVDLFITNGMARDFLHGDLLEVVKRAMPNG